MARCPRFVEVMVTVMLLSTGVFSEEEIPPIASNQDCLSCNPEECLKASGCVAGIVKDSCGCCDVCGKVEYSLCDHPKVSIRRFIDFLYIADRVITQIMLKLHALCIMHAGCYTGIG